MRSAELGSQFVPQEDHEMLAFRSQLTANRLGFFVAVAFSTAGCWFGSQGDKDKHEQGKIQGRLIFCRKGGHDLLGISEKVGCLLEATSTRPNWNDPPGEIAVTAYSLSNQIALWKVRLVGKWLTGWSSSVSPDGSYVAAKLITHKGPLVEDPYYAQVVFFDLKQQKIAWMWPEKPVAIKRGREQSFSPIYFATDEDAFWSTREDNKSVIYKLNVSRGKADVFLREGEDTIRPLVGAFRLQAYSPATQELLVSSGKDLYAIKVGPERHCRVLVQNLPLDDEYSKVHVSSNGATIAVLGQRELWLLHGAPDFKVCCKLDASKMPELSHRSSVACSPDGRYVAYCYFAVVMFPAKFVILDLSGHALHKFDAGPLAEFCYPIIWLEGGRKIVAVGSYAWAIWELQGLNQP